MKCSTNLNLVYVSYTQGGKEDFRDAKGLRGDSLPGRQRFDWEPSHLYIWHGAVGLFLAAVESDNRKRPERQEPVILAVKPQGQQKWLFSGCREQTSLET